MSTPAFLNHFTNIVSDSRNDVVFEQRNKEYGAFVLRRDYNKRVATALYISVGIMVLAFAMPKIIELLASSEEEVVVPVNITEVNLDAPPPVDESEPPPPPPPPPPVMETVKFTPPVVTNEEVIEDPPPVQTDETPQISTVTQEGSGDEQIVIPEETGNGAVAVEEEVFTIVEQMPEFPGGTQAMYDFIGKNMVYPAIGREENISGKVYLRFKVNSEGKISNIEIQKGIKGYPQFEKEAERVVKMMPSFKPGKQNGRAVSVWFGMPVNFSIK